MFPFAEGGREGLFYSLQETDRQHSFQQQVTKINEF